MSLPAFSELPLRNGDPPYSAWGLYGKDDNLGTLNLLTPAVVQKAATEIKEGLRFSLNWDLALPVTTGFGRYKDTFSHTIKAGSVMDDSINFNTQKSTQWDGLRHFAYQKEQLWYNGTTQEQIQSSKEPLGLHHWHKAGGIAGRGVLIDYWAWAEANGKPFDATQPYNSIAYDDLMACFQWQQEQSSEPLALQTGDILLIRQGFHVRYAQLDEAQERAVGQAWPPASCGVHQDVRLLQWLWDSHVAAVGGDAPALENFPPDEKAGFMLHEVLLSGWGCPIAEMLCLDDLAAFCRERKRWTFFVSSSPLNVQGGVGSPANMMALV